MTFVRPSFPFRTFGLGGGSHTSAVQRLVITEGERWQWGRERKRAPSLKMSVLTSVLKHLRIT